MKRNKTSEEELTKIYDELQRRIQNIGIALYGQRIRPVQLSGHYDLSRTDTPSVDETENAFMRWNCAILTAFRGSETLTPEANLERNIKRNSELKAKMIEQNLQFRSVNGCYREANWEKANVEYCFFVTNTGEDSIKDFFCKMYRLAELYEQDSFLFTFPGANRVAFLVATNDDGRAYFRGDIKFAGPLFTHVSDIGDWTDCSDGRISFRLKGMIQMGGTGNKKIKIGEGDLFDTESYGSNGLVVVSYASDKDLKRECKKHDKEKVPLATHWFKSENTTPDRLRKEIFSCLNKLRDQRCKTIGILCTIAVNGSSLEGAACAYDSIKQWAAKNGGQFKRIVIVDPYGDYAKVLDNNK